jgi:neopullulanase
MEGKEDPDNRRDFPGGFPADKRSAFEATERTAVERRMFDWTRAWIRLRSENSALRRGRLIDLFYDDESYVFARQLKNQTVIIALNRADQERTIPVPAATIGLRDGTELRAFLGAKEPSRVANGSASLLLPAKTAVAYGVRLVK